MSDDTCTSSTEQSLPVDQVDELFMGRLVASSPADGACFQLHGVAAVRIPSQHPQLAAERETTG